ncbi:MAG: DJ-1/PfpI family protein [Candidatus Hodarchaeales archaeon]
MVQNILVFLYPGCAEFEIAVACWQIAESEKYEIITLAYDYTPISTNSRFKMIPNQLVSDNTKIRNIAGIIIPGGSFFDLRIELKALLKDLNNQGKLLAAICAGPQYLAGSGVIGSRFFTTSRTPVQYIEEGAPDPFDWNQFKDQRVVVDENMITAKGYAFSDFAIEIWNHLGLISNDEDREEWRLLFIPQN